MTTDSQRQSHTAWLHMQHHTLKGQSPDSPLCACNWLITHMPGGAFAMSRSFHTHVGTWDLKASEQYHLEPKHGTDDHQLGS